jgi:WS/DGAT/MGAT family acyltransferase
MHKLSGLDEMFLSVDTGTTTGVMGGLVIYDRPAGSDAGSAAAMVERVTERLNHLPPLRWQLTKVPFGIDHAYWREAETVDVPAHVRTRHLAAPGTHQELATEVAAIMAQPLDKDRPLWEIVVFEGLEGGQVAHLLRMHHGVIDGASVPTILDILSDDPSVPLGDITEVPVRKELLPGKLGMLGRGLVGTAQRPFKLMQLQMSTARWFSDRIEHEGVMTGPAFVARMLPGGLGKPLRAVVNARQRAVGKDEVQPLVPALRKPSTPFNKTVTAERTYAFSDLPLADFKKVGKAFGVTLNDVVLAVVAGTLRRYLEPRGGIPDKPLTVVIPASIRTGEENPYWANHVSMFFAQLPTEVEDPVERLLAAGSRVKSAKGNFDALPTELLRPLSEFIPMAAWSVPQKVLTKAPNWLPTSQWNVVVSNVRGPAKPVSVTGATMVGYWPAAFLTMGVGLNITLQSYVDRVDFGFMGATDLTGDLWELPGYMEEELTTLLEAAAALEAGEAADASKTPRRRTAVTATAKPATKRTVAARSRTTSKSSAATAARRTNKRTTK